MSWVAGSLLTRLQSSSPDISGMRRSEMMRSGFRRAAAVHLAGALGLLQSGNVAGFESMVANFQATSQRIKYALVPVVAAVRGLALGGGCEFQMHAARVVAHLESYIGLVEAGVGLLPAG